MEPRLIKANEQVKDLKNMVSLASGPIIYSLESADNGNIDHSNIDTTKAMQVAFQSDLLNGVNTISGKFTNGENFTAVPYYAIGNREIKGHQVWLSLPKSAHITVNSNQIESELSPLIYASNIEDVNHEIYGGFYDQRIFGESFEEPATGVNFNQWRRYTGYWTAKDDAVEIIPGRNTTSDVVMNGVHRIGVEPDQSAKLIYEPKELANGTVETEIKFIGNGESGALLVRVANAGVGNDIFDGYEIILSRDGKKVAIGKHRQNFELLKEVEVNVNPEVWNKIKVTLHGPQIEIYLNNEHVLSYKDEHNPLLKGKIGLRTWRSAIAFRNVTLIENGKTELLKLVNTPDQQVSYNWDIIQTGNAKASFSLIETTAYNGKNSQLIDFKNGSGKVGIANRSLNRWGIAVRKDQEFQGRVYLKANQLSGPVSIALESADGSKTYATKQLSAIGSSWKKFPFTLTSNILMLD